MKTAAEFIALLGGAAAAWPPAARAQQQPMPVVGYLSTRSLGDSAYIVAAFRKGLHEVGDAEGRNVAIEFRFAEGHHDRLPALAADLVRRQVNVFVATGGTASAVAAKTMVPATIPMVFAMGGDPVKLGLVDNLARPAGNATGISFLVSEMAAKHVQLLDELAPQSAVIGFLVNPNNPNLAAAATAAQEAADMLRRKLVVVKASTESDSIRLSRCLFRSGSRRCSSKAIPSSPTTAQVSSRSHRGTRCPRSTPCGSSWTLVA